MTFYVYMLRCADGSFYIGHTDNLENRRYEHQMKKYNGYTSTRLPIQLVFHEAFPTRDEAFAAERKLKGWMRKKKIILIKYGWEGFVKNKCK
ncbi:MAG: GIY-YIG nuclease family protein [bacterium]